MIITTRELGELLAACCEDPQADKTILGLQGALESELRLRESYQLNYERVWQEVNTAFGMDANRQSGSVEWLLKHIRALGTCKRCMRQVGCIDTVKDYCPKAALWTNQEGVYFCDAHAPGSANWVRVIE